MNEITPQLIPHFRFHLGIWLLPMNNPNWYYFMEKKNRNSITNTGFYESIDKPLRKLVELLHHKGIKTTPSCSGHQYSEKKFERIFQSLEKNKNEIKTCGLNFKNIETGKIYFYKNEHYQLPWSREKFIDCVIKYQKKGIIGIRFEKKLNLKSQVKRIKVEGTNIKEKDGIVFISTKKSKGNNNELWKKITLEIEQLL